MTSLAHLAWEESLEIVKAFGFLATMGKHQAALLSKPNFGLCREGFTIMSEEGMANVKIAADSSTAVKLINERTPENHHNRALIEDSRMLLARNAANQSEDNLARLGAEQAEELVTVDIPPSTRPYVIADKRGAGHLRL